MYSLAAGRGGESKKQFAFYSQNYDLFEQEFQLFFRVDLLNLRLCNNKSCACQTGSHESIEVFTILLSVARFIIALIK